MSVAALGRTPPVHLAAAQPSEAEVRAIRKAFNDPGATDMELSDAPKPVQRFADAMERKEHKEGHEDVAIYAQELPVGTKTYYVVMADNEGNGYGEIVNAQGQRITGFGFTESGMSGWDSSPGEAREERAASAKLSRLFTRSALGTSKLAPYELSLNELPPRLKDLWDGPRAGVKEDHFYKVQVGNRTLYANYALYRDPGDRTGDKLGVVTLYDANQRYFGAADLYKDGKDKLPFEVSFADR